MKHLLTLSLLLLPLLLTAQTWQELYDTTNDCWDKDWPTGIEILEKAQEVARKEFGPKDSIYLLTINDLGVAYMEMAKHEKALVLLEESRLITGEQLGKEHTEYAVRLYNLGWLHYI